MNTSENIDRIIIGDILNDIVLDGDDESLEVIAEVLRKSRTKIDETWKEICNNYPEGIRQILNLLPEEYPEE